jgi:hypothetical protein
VQVVGHHGDGRPLTRAGRRLARLRKQRLLWTVLLANVPTRLLSLEEALEIGRARWQIELLFKLWQSQGRIDASTSARPHRVLCELYAKLVAMIIQHWVLLVSGSEQVDRSLVKAPL